MLAKVKTSFNLRNYSQAISVHFIVAGTNPCAQGALFEEGGITQL